MVRPARAVGDPRLRDAGPGRAELRARRVRGQRGGRAGVHRGAAHVPAHRRALRRVAGRVRRRRSRLVAAPAGPGPHHRDPRRRRPRRVLPGADRGVDRRDAPGARRVPRRRRLRRPRRGVGRAAARRVPGRGDPRAATPHPGRHRARGAADPRRVPAAAPRRRPPASPHRGAEAGPRRPRPVRDRPGRDAPPGRRPARRPVRRHPPGRPPRRRGGRPGGRVRPARRDRVPLRGGPRRAAGQPHPVELHELRRRVPRPRVGHQPQQPGVLVLPRRRPGQRVRARRNGPSTP